MTIIDRKTDFRSLGEAWADTAALHGRLMLTVLGGSTEFERKLIRPHMAVGEVRARAKASGVMLVRQPELAPVPAARGDPAA